MGPYCRRPLWLGRCDHEIAILGTIAVSFLNQEFAALLAIGRGNLAAAGALRIHANERIGQLFFQHGQGPGLPVAIDLGDLAQGAVAFAGLGGLTFLLTGQAGIDDVRPKRTIVAKRLADQIAIFVGMGELDNASRRGAIRLGPSAFACPFQRAIGLQLLQDFAQHGAFAPFYVQAAGNVLFGRCVRIVSNEIEHRFLIWETHTAYIGGLAEKCAGLLCSARFRGQSIASGRDITSTGVRANDPACAPHFPVSTS